MLSHSCLARAVWACAAWATLVKCDKGQEVCVNGTTNAQCDDSQGTVDAQLEKCGVVWNENKTHSLAPAFLQYRFWEFYEKDLKPPLNEAAWLLELPERLNNCPSMRAVTLYFLAETALYYQPKEEWEILVREAGKSMGEMTTLDTRNWPIELAKRSFEKTRDSLQPASSNINLDVVICHCRESLHWLKTMPVVRSLNARLLIYEKCGKNAKNEQPEAFHDGWKSVESIDTPDPPRFRKDECIAFLRHLIDRRNDIAEYTIFMQADAKDHLDLNYLRLVFRILVTTKLDVPFLHLNMHRVVKALTPCKQAIYHQLFDRDPQNLQFYCCAQFLVRRDRIMDRDKGFYENMARMMDEQTPQDKCNDIPGHSTHCLMYEGMWHVLFGEQDYMPLHEDHTAVPYVLRVPDTESETNLPVGAFADTILTYE